MNRCSSAAVASLLVGACATVTTASESPQQESTWGVGKGKSYLVPAADIVGFQFVLNQYDRHFDDPDTYGTDLSTIEDNLHRGWVIDNDPFAVNQIGHPYQGSIYHGFARSAGLSYWESLAYDFGASALWEIAGETDPPSLNDQITTSFGGSFLGEALFRMASLVLAHGNHEPGFARELGAAAISPPTGFQRLAYGSRFDAVYPSNDPPVFWRAGIGSRRNERVRDIDVLDDIPKGEAIADFALEYGAPGKPDYDYERPFDYFSFEATATSSAHALPENVLVRGLLVGSKYKWGDHYRGVWGLYGSYDYIAPELFSISSTAVSLGTTGQWWISDAVSMQGTCLGGVGWTAVGTIADAQTDRDYQYGSSPQGVVALRLRFGSRVLLETTAREFYVRGGSSDDEIGSANILRGQASLTVRVYGHHALAIQFVESRRDADIQDLPDTLQSVGAVSLFYTYLGDEKLGALERP